MSDDSLRGQACALEKHVSRELAHCGRALGGHIDVEALADDLDDLARAAHHSELCPRTSRRPALDETVRDGDRLHGFLQKAPRAGDHIIQIEGSQMIPAHERLPPCARGCVLSELASETDG